MQFQLFNKVMLISFKDIDEEREKYLKIENITLMGGSETKN